MADVMIITGTRKGIGLFLAKKYLERGYIVVGCSREPFAEVVEPHGDPSG